MKSRRLIDGIFIDERVAEYIVDLVSATRKPGEYGMAIDHFIRMGASPRATVALALAAKAWAFLHGRAYVTPQDVKAIGLDVLSHRVVTTYLAEAENITGEVIAAKVLNTVRVR